MTDALMLTMMRLVRQIFATSILWLEHNTKAETIGKQSILFQVRVATVVALLGTVIPLAVAYRWGASTTLLQVTVVTGPAFALLLSFLGGVTTMQTYQNLVVENLFVHGESLNVAVNPQETVVFSMSVSEWFDDQLYTASVIGLIGTAISWLFAIITIIQGIGVS